MLHRRRVLIGIGAIGSTAMLAGCSGGSEAPESSSDSGDGESNTTAPTDSSDDEQEADVLPEISVDGVNLTYGFSSGLQAQITLRNENEEERKNVYTKIEAFNGESSIGSDATWKEIAPELTAEANLTIDIGSLSENDIDDVTEFVISGRLEGDETLGAIESLSGDELRARVEDS